MPQAVVQGATLQCTCGSAPSVLTVTSQQQVKIGNVLAATVMDNVLFGRVGNNHPDAPDRIRSIVYDILDELGIYAEVLDVGLDFNVGSGGRRSGMATRG